MPASGPPLLENPTATTFRSRLARIGKVSVRDYGILVAIAIFVVVVQIQNDSFLTKDNLLNIGDQWAPVAIMAAGMTFVLIGGGFDLSVGSVLAFSATLSASIVANHSAVLAFLAAMGLGIGVGVLNGLLVTWLNINPFIATLGTAQMVRGFALIYSDGGTYRTSSDFLDAIGRSKVAGIPVPVLIMLGVMIVLGLVLAYTVYGRRIYAIGGNDEASFLGGVRTDRIRASTYVISGACAALAGVIYAGRIGSGQGNLAAGIELDVIAAALIGGISIAGGEGAMWRAAAGVALLAILQNFFNQANVGGFWQLVVKGGIIITAVGIDSYSKKRHRRPLGATLKGVFGKGWPGDRGHSSGIERHEEGKGGKT
jgi:ribose transport system permease protein